MKITKIFLSILALSTINAFAAQETTATITQKAKAKAHAYKVKAKKKIDDVKAKIHKKSESLKKEAQKKTAKKSSYAKATEDKLKSKGKHALPERDPKTGRFESSHELKPKKASKAVAKTKTKSKHTLPARDLKTGRFESSHELKPKDKTITQTQGKTASKTHDTLSKPTQRSTARTAALGAAAAGALGAKTYGLTDQQKIERKAFLARDREQAALDKDWQRSKNIKTYDRYNALRHQTKDQRKQFGWRWLKAPWSTDTVSAYGFWHNGCGWMYFDTDKNQWWIPCGGGYWSKTPIFQVGHESNI